MAISLGSNQYGKAENRVMRVYRDTDRHSIRDLNVSTSLRGDFTAAHLEGNQGDVLPTDTQKNTSFAFAKEVGIESPEAYGVALGKHFLTAAYDDIGLSATYIEQLTGQPTERVC